MKQPPTFKEAMKFWLRLGFISFGGPAGQIGIMHEFLVEKKKWISDSKFLHALNYCMLLPGPEAQQLATYTGWLLHGRKGGLAAGILFVLPSMFILLFLSIIYVLYGNLPWINAMFEGLKPAVIAIVIVALIKIAKRALLNPFHYIVALAAFSSIFFLNIAFPLIIVGALIVAAITEKFYPAIMAVKKHNDVINDPLENQYYLNKYSRIENIGYRPKKIIKQIATFLLLWILPLAGLYLLAGDFLFWKRLILFFTQAAFVTFGGAYAVLPYVAQVSVENYEWLSSLEMVDGLALGETTPGPLIMVLAFVGFMAGYNYFGASLIIGTIALVATTFYTFLPCFLFIFLGAPIIEQTQENKKLKEILSLVTAAVVGVVLNLTIYLGNAVIFPEGISWASFDLFRFSWVILSFFALYYAKIGMISWIGISALSGLAYFFIFG